MPFTRLTTKVKDGIRQYRSRSRSPSSRNGPLQSLPGVQTSISAGSATSDCHQNAPTAPAVDGQRRHSLPIPTINEPTPERESSLHDTPPEAGVELSVEPGNDDEKINRTKTPSEEIWDCAYDEVKAEEPALVQAYERILTTQLLCKNDTLTEAIAEVNQIDQHDKENRRRQMQQLVKNGLDKISRESKIKSRIGSILPLVNVSKDIVTNVVKGVPQAALPWAAVSLSLELLTNPISETKANSTGVTHVLGQMDWYCEQAMLLFSNQDGITAGIQQQLRTELIDLYKKMLSFEIKSIYSYYRHRGLIFLHDLVKLDDWEGNLDEIKDAEAFFNRHFHAYQSIDLGQDVKQLVVHAKAEQEYRKTDEDRKCLRDLYITDPRMDKTRIETTKGGLVQDSWRWILNHPDYQTWLHDDEKRLLWVKGDPGKGKTMLLCGLVDEITNRVAQSDGAISYFFCQATMPTINNHLAVLRGLIWLLADQQPSLISHVREKYDPTGKDLFEGANAWYSLKTIFRTILHDERLATTYVIIDGLDECITGLSELLELIKEALPLQNVKWILSSRNWPEIQASLEDTPDAEGVNLSLEVNAAVVAAAVDAYISEKAFTVKFLKKNDQLREDVCNVVREKANGTFLWVSIVFQQLQRVKLPYGGFTSLMERLKGLPEDLTKLYDRMLQQIEAFESIEESNLCRVVLGICVVAYQPLHLQELATLAGFKDELAEPSELQNFIGACGSFLTVKEETVYFIHQSSKEYLTTSNRAQSTLFPNGTDEIHHAMVTHSLETMGEMLGRDMYKLHDHVILIEDISTSEPDPLVSLHYSCSHWLRHLCVSMASFNMSDGKVLNFLKVHILHWLEVMSLMRNSFEGVRDIIHFEALLEQHYPNSELLHLVHDIRRFTQHNSWIINNAPLQIYLSAILFTPKLSVVRALFEEELLSWITVKPFVESHWSPCLQTIEVNDQTVGPFALSPDEKMIASGSTYENLRIWDVVSGKQMSTLETVARADETKKGIRQIIFSRDSRRIFAAVDERLDCWDVYSGTHDHTRSLGAWPSISNDGKFIASRTIDGIEIQDMYTGKQLRLVPDYYDYGDRSWRGKLKLSNGVKYLAFGADEITIWDLERHAKHMVIDSSGHAQVSFSTNSMLMACGSGDLKIWDLATKCEVRIIPTIENGREACFMALEFSIDSKRLAGADMDYIRIWDVVTGTLLTKLECDAYSLSWFQDSSMLASKGLGDIQLWDTATSFEPEPVPDIGGYTDLQDIAVNNDHKLVATRSSDAVKVWDTTTGSELAVIEIETDGTRLFSSGSVGFSPDSKFVYVRHQNATTITQWAFDSELEATHYEIPLGNREYTPSTAFSIDGRLFAGATANGRVKIWDMSTGYKTVHFTVDHASIWAMAFSNSAQYLSLSFSDASVGVWDVITGDRIKQVKGHVCEMNGERGCSTCKHLGEYSLLAVSNNARRVLVVNVFEQEVWIQNEGQKIIRLILGHPSHNWLFGFRESYIATWGGYLDLDDLQADCETQAPYQIIALEDSKFEGYGLSYDDCWITWNGSNAIWLPLAYRPSIYEADADASVTILPLGLFIVEDGKVHIFRFSGPPPR